MDLVDDALTQLGRQPKHIYTKTAEYLFGILFVFYAFILSECAIICVHVRVDVDDFLCVCVCVLR